MSSLETHCAMSLALTGKEYRELHKWMDEPFKDKGKEHREERHNLDCRAEVKSRWGEQGVEQFLIHIIVDFQDTKKKLENLFHEVKAEKMDEKYKLEQLQKEFEKLQNNHTDSTQWTFGPKK